MLLIFFQVRTTTGLFSWKIVLVLDTLRLMSARFLEEGLQFGMEVSLSAHAHKMKSVYVIVSMTIQLLESATMIQLLPLVLEFQKAAMFLSSMSPSHQKESMKLLCVFIVILFFLIPQ